MDIYDLQDRILSTWVENKDPCFFCKTNKCLNDIPEGYPLFHQEGDPCANILVIMEAPNKDDTVLEKPRITIEDSEDLTGQYIKNIKEVVAVPILVTNAVLCLPMKKKGKYNVSRQQLKTCNYWLKKFINLVNPQIVVSFGRIAFDATQLIEKYNLKFTKAYTTPSLVRGWYSRLLIVTAHPHARITSTKRNQNKRDIITLLTSVIKT